jgi:hypothetical protein
VKDFAKNLTFTVLASFFKVSVLAKFAVFAHVFVNISVFSKPSLKKISNDF